MECGSRPRLAPRASRHADMALHDGESLNAGYSADLYDRSARRSAATRPLSSHARRSRVQSRSADSRVGHHRPIAPQTAPGVAGSRRRASHLARRIHHAAGCDRRGVGIPARTAGPRSSSTSRTISPRFRTCTPIGLTPLATVSAASGRDRPRRRGEGSGRTAVRSQAAGDGGSHMGQDRGTHPRSRGIDVALGGAGAVWQRAASASGSGRSGARRRQCRNPGPP